jgi:hypothetical protein
MKKNNDIMKDLQVFILYSIKMMLIANEQDSKCMKIFPDELKVLTNISNNIQTETDDKRKFIKCHIAIRVFYELLKKNDDFKIVYDDISKYMFQKDKTIFTDSMMTDKNYDILNNMISTIGTYQIMDNLVNTPTA